MTPTRFRMIAAMLLMLSSWVNSQPLLRLDFSATPRPSAAATMVAEVSHPDSTVSLRVSDSREQARLLIRLKDAGSLHPGISRDAQSLTLASDNLTHRVYRKSPTELEWEIILKRRPLDSVLCYPIALSGIAGCYQPPLTASEIEEGATRPDSVIGSYAFYDLRTGVKQFHLYRPRAWDSNGDTVWCGLLVDRDGAALQVAIPGDFLSRAIYPITVDPTFGFTACGASSAPVAGTVCYANSVDSYTASTGDYITRFHGYFRGVGDGSLDMAAYTLSGGVPSQRLAAAVTVPIAGSSVAELNSSSTVNQPLSGGETYVIAFGNEIGDVRYAYDVQSDAASIHTSSSTLPATWSEGATSDRRLSLFVTYESGGTTEILSLRRRRNF